MKNKITKICLLFSISFFMIGLIILPLCSLFIKAFQNKNGEYIGFKNFIDYFSNPNTASSLFNSLKVAGTVTILTVVIAILFAYGVNRTNIKLKRGLNFIALLPLFAPTMTHGIGLIYIFGRQGIFTKFTGVEFPIYGFYGIVLAEIIFIFPVLYFMLALSLKNEDYRKYEVAQLMGINRIRQFFTITIPSIKYTIITCIFSAFTLSFTDFGAPKVIGGNYNILATDIFKQVIGQQNFSMGSTVGILLIIPAFITFLIDFFIKNKNSKLDAGAIKYKIKENKQRDFYFSLFNYTIAFLIIFLLGVIALSSFVKAWPYNMTLSLKSYQFTVMGESIWKIYFNSIIVSLLSAILGTTLCFFTAYIIERENRYLIVRKIGYFLSILPNAIPGLTIGLSYIFFFNSKFNPLNFIYGTFIIIIFANVVHFFTTPFLTMTNSLKKIDREYESISNLMGIPWYKTVFKVILPLSFDSIVESFSYYFINSLITISAIVFLYTSKTRMVSIMMISKNDSGDITAASAMAVMIIITNIVFKCVFDFLIKYIKERNYLKKRKDRLRQEKQSEILRQNGREVLSILNRVSKNTNVKYWLEFGTLLGKVRENNFIGHDINFDIGVMADELSPKFLIDIEKEGFIRKSSLSLKNEGLKDIKYFYKDIEIEIFIFEREKNKVLCYSEDKEGRIGVYKLSNSTLEETKFMGVDTYVPRNSIKRLLEIYGKNFNVSDSSWKDEMSPSLYITDKEKE